MRLSPSLSESPAWTDEEKAKAVELHTTHCFAGCTEEAGWGWLKLARSTLMLAALTTSLHPDPESEPTPEEA